MPARSQRLPYRIQQTIVVILATEFGTPASSDPTGGLAERVETLEVQLDRMERLLELSVQPWEPVATTVREFDTWMRSDERVRQYEFAIMRNGGFRILHVSHWNGGYRFMTEPYWRGDTPKDFSLGGSFWIIGTKDPAETDCKGKPALHYYYQFVDGTVKISGGNECHSDGPVYARKRLFKEDLE